MLRTLPCLLVLMMSILLPSLSFAADWWQEDWKFRKQIFIDTTPKGGNISAPVGRAPVLMRLHSGNFSFDGANEKGSDLRFVAADGKTVLNHQIESFNPALGMATVWVDVPAIKPGERQEIWMYYGNKAAPDAANGQSVFDPNYVLVYHFGGGADAMPRDATAYANHAQKAVGAATDGVIGRALQLAGQPLILPASPSLAVPAGGEFTFSAWLRVAQPKGTQLIYARRDAGNALLIGLNQGAPFVEINGQRSGPAQALAAGAWQHLAVTARGQQVQLFVNGHPAASLAAALPAFSSAAAIGGDAPTANSATASSFAPFSGAIAEVRISKVARPEPLILADAISQGKESRLLQYGADEEQAGFGFAGLTFLIKAVPFDAWIVLAILAFMMAQTWSIMIVKFRRTKRLQTANDAFREAFSRVGMHLEMLADDARAEGALNNASLWRLYAAAVNELRIRRQQGADTTLISSATIEAIRVSMDAVRTRETLELGSRLGTLSNAIAGGPYIGLLGTVLGIMVVFLGTAMAGDVNINAIAPGMAAALMATAAGLFVAIPALFGYNRIIARNKEIGADMRVFVDEFVARLAEAHGEGQSMEIARMQLRASAAAAPATATE
ncbi:DUF2341 domain-containing protein [Chromobacterium sp. IIBBL 290-4]|uniref:DUF2341 domain-containing protein n=1 Tax=Chromobacterium sp. IIBBL 290-4 TaxID=2953890 RepID=UPI0020B7D592|nr:MotA/TolQ/ExbB proton channel family protein [Chromobacterium sp. IIBBL 290-4]UTH74479.1 DUF2341 domain-containing protein [Chromobacterium sp. IIBBL 290-4]